MDNHGREIARAGDPQWVTFSRSTIKPFQALPLLRSSAPQQMGLDSQDFAMLCASHSGEPMHVQRVDRLLEKARVSRSSLRCGCHVPIFTELGLGPSGDYDERHHNCSGKHAGFLAYCVHHGLRLDSYCESGHELQVAVREVLSAVVGIPTERMRVGLDGCSAPNYAFPLAGLARGYARLASGDRDPDFGDSFAVLLAAMASHPELVSGTLRSDLAFTLAGRGDWVSKVGVDGVQAFGSRRRGQAFAIKISDGNLQALFSATVEVLDQLGWLDDVQRADLERWRTSSVTNAHGTVTGVRSPVLQLQFSA